MKKLNMLAVSAVAAGLLLSANTFAGEAKPVNITKGLMEVTVTHDGKKTAIKRNQDNENDHEADKNENTPAVGTMPYSRKEKSHHVLHNSHGNYTFRDVKRGKRPRDLSFRKKSH